MHLIFVHIPKTAGTALRSAIADRVGHQAIDYPMTRIGAKGWLRRNAAAIAGSLVGSGPHRRVLFGHFMAGRYGRFNGWDFSRRPGCFYATMLREPLQRAMSHYHHWRRVRVDGHAVWERFMRENWSLERFLAAPEIANLQSRFLWRFPLRRFDAVLLQERYHESLALLGRRFPELADLPEASANANPERGRDEAYDVDAGLADSFRRRNRADYALYAEACAIFAADTASADGTARA